MRAAGDLGEDVLLTVERGERSFASGDRVMFLQNERGLGVKNGTLGTVEKVSARSMSVRTDDGRSVSFDLKDYDRIDHGYAATIHKAQGMTVDRAHVLATPGMDAHGSYVALSRHRDGMDLHYGHDDFASQDRLARALSRDRAKDMASDYERLDPAQDYAERRGITFRARVAEIVRKIVPEKVRGMFDGLRLPADGGQRPEREGAGKEGGGRPGDGVAPRPHQGARPPCPRGGRDLRDAGTRGGKASPEQVKELPEARKVFEEVRPYGWHDAEAAYKKNPELALEAATGAPPAPSARSSSKPNCAPIRSAAPTASWNAGGNSTKPASASTRQATCPATRPRGQPWATWRRASNAIRSLNRSSPTASGTSASGSNRAADSGWNSPSVTASTSAEAGASDFNPAYFPPPMRHSTTTPKSLLHNNKSLLCLVPAAVRNNRQEAAQPCPHQTVSSA